MAVASAALEAFAVAYSAHLAFWAETENIAVNHRDRSHLAARGSTQWGGLTQKVIIGKPAGKAIMSRGTPGLFTV